MDIEQHIHHTQSALGVSAEDIHKWIDGYFDEGSFRQFIENNQKNDAYNSYTHRRYRHCQEALSEVLHEFKNSYSEEIITNVFYMHLRDDYHGNLPHRPELVGTDLTNYRDKEDKSGKYLFREAVDLINTKM